MVKIGTSQTMNYHQTRKKKLLCTPTSMQQVSKYTDVVNKLFSLILSFLLCCCFNSNETEEPRPSLNCPRLNGYFAHKGTCDKFYYCVDGMFNMITCPAGLVFNPKTGAPILQTNKISQ